MDAERAHGIVQHIALRRGDLLDLELELAPAVRKDVVQLDIAVLIGTVLANQVVVLVLNEKAHPVNSLAGHGIDLFNTHAGELFVLEGDRRQFASPDGHVLRGRVKTVPLRTGSLGHDIDVILQTGNRDKAGGIRGVSADQLAICLFHRKRAAVQRLVCAFYHLADLQTIGALVRKNQLIIAARLDLNGLGHVLQNVPIRRFGFGHDQCAVREPRQGNNAVFVGLGTVFDKLAVRFGDRKNRVFQRLSGILIYFADGKAGASGIGECHLVGLAGTDFDGLGCFIDRIAIRRSGLCDHECAGLQFRQVDQAIGVGHSALAHNRTVPARDFEHSALQRLFRFAVDFFNQQAGLFGVLHSKLGVLGSRMLDLKHLTVEDVF